MGKQKGLKTVVWALYILLMIATFLVVFIYEYLPQKHNLILEVKSSGSTYGEGSDFSENIYSKSTIEINSADDFKLFYNSLSHTYTYRETEGSTGHTFTAFSYPYSGKTVKLNRDIYVPDGLLEKEQCTFKGVFDGQGYTISGFSASNDYYEPNEGKEFLGLFQINSGTIKNTCFQLFELSIPSGLDADTYAGCIVGLNKGTIENCIVKDSKFISDRYRTNCNVAPIAGVNNGVIKNCLVRGEYKIGGKSWNLMSNADGLNSYYFTASGTKPTDSIFVATVTKVTNADNDGSYVSTPSDSGDSLGSGNYSSCATAYSSMSSSTASKTAGESGTPWYKYSVNTRGFGRSASFCVYLRSFISWTTYKFTASPSGGGTINYSTLTVPTDYNNVTEVTNNQLLIDLNYVTPTPAEGNEFDKWTNSGNTYTANFIVRIQLSFTTATNTTIDSSSTASTGTTYYLANPTTITFTHEDYIKPNCFKSYTISFTDKNGTAYFIKYKANTNYYISGNTMTAKNTNYSMSSNKTNIKVNTGFKSYDVTIK